MPAKTSEVSCIILNQIIVQVFFFFKIPSNNDILLNTTALCQIDAQWDFCLL